MITAPPYGSDLEARLARVQTRTEARISRRRRRARSVIAVGVTTAGLVLTVGGISTAFYPHYVDSAAAVRPEFADAFAACMATRGWDVEVLPPEAARSDFPEGDGVLVRITTLDSDVGGVGREVDRCRLSVEKDVGESVLPPSLLSGGESTGRSAP